MWRGVGFNGTQLCKACREGIAMKRIILFVTVFAIAFVFAGCRSEETIKKDIFKLVESNYDTVVEAYENKDADALYAIDGIEDVNIVEGYILVYCEGQGIAPSSQDYGFYYSEENLPVAVDCNNDIVGTNEELVAEGDGYKYYDQGGNSFYTEHIKGNIYFYSNNY